jgi:uncharacterized protein (DUF1697 family)
MTAFVALLRAVNVGGSGKLPISDLRRLCKNAGFEQVTTYIASGNVVFRSEHSEADIRSALEAALHGYGGKPVGVVLRSGAEMAGVLASNPFPACHPARTVVLFLPEPPAAEALTSVIGCNGEEFRLGLREIYVHYGDGMAASKLRIPAAVSGTVRNMNTVAKLVEMASRL